MLPTEMKKIIDVIVGFGSNIYWISNMYRHTHMYIFAHLYNTQGCVSQLFGGHSRDSGHSSNATVIYNNERS